MRFTEAVKLGREIYQLGYKLKQKNLTVRDMPQVFPQEFKQLESKLENISMSDVFIAQIGGMNIGPIRYFQTSRYFCQSKKV